MRRSGSVWRWRWSDEVRLWARGDVSPCGRTKAPSVRGLASASETGGENKRLKFSPSGASRHLPRRGRRRSTDGFPGVRPLLGNSFRLSFNKSVNICNLLLQNAKAVSIILNWIKFGLLPHRITNKEMSKTVGRNCPQTRQTGIKRVWGISRAQKPQRGNRRT